MNNKHYPFIIVVLFSLALSFVYCPPFDLFFDDKEIFKYTGFLIKEGAVPYKDFFDHKPPLIYFLNWLGAVSGSWGFWLIDMALVLFSSLQFLKLNIKYKVIFPFILPVLFNLILRNSHISNGIGMTREYTTILTLAFFCIMLNKGRFHFFFMGLLASLIFFIQQDQVVILFPFIVYSLFKGFSPQYNFIKKTGMLFAGFLAVLLPLIIYFTITGALNLFWQDAFLFNLQWYTSPDQKPGLVRELLTIKKILYDLKFDTLFLLTCLLAIVSLVKGSKTKWLLIACLCSIPLSFISEFLSGKLATGDAYCNYYFLPLAATIPVTLFVVFAFTGKMLFRNKVYQFILGCLLIFNPAVSIAEHVVNYHRYPQDYIDRSAEIKHLDNDPPEDYQLYVFNNSNYIYAYNKYQVKTPSKWLYHYFWNWYRHWDSDQQVIHSIIADLQKHRTKYIISFGAENDFKNADIYKTWTGFLDSSYRQIKPMNLWQLKQ